MNILLIGSGGREHAIAWKLAQSPSLAKLYAVPGNPGIAVHADCVAIDVGDHGAVTAFCHARGIDLVVVGPEGPLVAGLADDLRAAGIAVFGPDRDAARLEGSKGFTKDLCAARGIPTARYVRVSGANEAVAALAAFSLPVVIKADGLASGKGVVVATTTEEAAEAAASIAGDGVIEEFLAGEEVSFFALSDGQCVVPFANAQDHKQLGEGDTGPNTGGMGAYSPASIFTPEIEARTMAEIIVPTVAALADAGTPFVGVLFAGLMLTADGPQLIEYNVRFGDPETQAMLPRYDGDLARLLYAVATGGLSRLPMPQFRTDACITVVMAAEGYPGTAAPGDAIHGLEPARRDHVEVFQAGTKLNDGQLVSAGGRVLAVTARAPTIGGAQQLAYTALEQVKMRGAIWRRDIGWKELARQGVLSANETFHGDRN